jgi:hypothetical protein
MFHFENPNQRLFFYGEMQIMAKIPETCDHLNAAAGDFAKENSKPIIQR